MRAWRKANIVVGLLPARAECTLLLHLLSMISQAVQFLEGVHATWQSWLGNLLDYSVIVMNDGRSHVNVDNTLSRDCFSMLYLWKLREVRLIMSKLQVGLSTIHVASHRNSTMACMAICACCLMSWSVYLLATFLCACCDDLN